MGHLIRTPDDYHYSFSLAWFLHISQLESERSFMNNQEPLIFDPESLTTEELYALVMANYKTLGELILEQEVENG